MIAAARDGTLRVLRAAAAAGVEARGDDVGRERGEPVVVRHRGRHRRDAVDRPRRPGADPLPPLEDPRRASGLGFHGQPSGTDRAGDGAARRRVRPRPDDGAPSARSASSGGWCPGKMRGIPRIGLEIVDVRDLADVHIRAMTSPDAAGQRFLATGEFMWMAEMARVLREGLGADGRKVSDPAGPGPGRPVRGPVHGPVATGDHPGARPPQPAHHREGQARPRLEAAARRETVLDCARSLIAHGAV